MEYNSKQTFNLLICKDEPVNLTIYKKKWSSRNDLQKNLENNWDLPMKLVKQCLIIKTVCATKPF